VAYALGTGLALVRKPGKLPAQTYSAHYELEYGKDTLEIHRDAIGRGHRVLLVDDLLGDGTGPLYGRGEPAKLAAAAEHILSVLAGDDLH
jgi:adenine phosphoribosyltransferase